MKFEKNQNCIGSYNGIIAREQNQMWRRSGENLAEGMKIDRLLQIQFWKGKLKNIFKLLAFQIFSYCLMQITQNQVKMIIWHMTSK